MYPDHQAMRIHLNTLKLEILLLLMLILDLPLLVLEHGLIIVRGSVMLILVRIEFGDLRILI